MIKTKFEYSDPGSTWIDLEIPAIESVCPYEIILIFKFDARQTNFSNYNNNNNNLIW